MRPLLYIAAPYTSPDPVANTHAVCRLAMIVYDETDWCPFVPHLSLLWQAVTPRPAAHWYEYDLHVLRQCDAIVRLPGESPGADREMDEAHSLGLKIVGFYDLPREARGEWNLNLLSAK
jgi:hypothetical protein